MTVRRRPATFTGARERWEGRGARRSRGGQHFVAPATSSVGRGDRTATRSLRADGPAPSCEPAGGGRPELRYVGSLQERARRSEGPGARPRALRSLLRPVAGRRAATARKELTVRRGERRSICPKAADFREGVPDRNAAGASTGRMYRRVWERRRQALARRDYGRLRPGVQLPSLGFTATFAASWPPH